jgi:ribosomal-protein-alanine N-acetyltransferase
MAILRSSQESWREAELSTPALYIRPPQMRDWRVWAELRAVSREFLTPWEPTWPSDALSRSAFRRRIRRQLRDGNDDIGYSFFVLRKSDDALLGGITLSNVQRGAAQCCNVGYWIGRPYARQGHMSEALIGILDHCFNGLGLHRVEAACMPNNRASQTLLEKSGFRREGYARDYLKIDGAWRDHILFAALSSRWRPPARHV